MNNLQTFISQMRWRVGSALFVSNLVLLLAWMFETIWHTPTIWIAITLTILILISNAVVTILITGYSIAPFKIVWQAILHLSPNGGQVAAPDVESLKLGRELVTGLLNQVYQLAAVAENTAKSHAEPNAELHANQIASRLPLPLFVLDKKKSLLFANEAALNYIQAKDDDINGKNIYSVLDLLFPSEDTLDSWLEEVSLTNATAKRSWERVRLNLPETPDKPARLFDLAAYYNRDNPLGYEILLVLFDHSSLYGQDDQALSLVALAVHELRIPITLLRGYIEALEDDMADRLSPEDREFLERTEAAGQQLAAFVNNVLNVARVEDNQFVVQLHEEDWAAVIESVIKDFELRARLAGINITMNIAPDLPPVGIDRLSMVEVLSNLVDNALKYTAKDGQVTIAAALTDNKLVETTVQDSGIGIPESVIPNLFDKFYRSHRSRGQVGGTGLGLYLCKTIVTAHGGNIWVRSREDQGSTFGFTIIPYAQVPHAGQTEKSDLTRVAHGWIKNHSLYRK